MKEPISRPILKVLACPVCKADLNYNKDKTALICEKCKVKYPIKQGIPVLLPSEQ